MATSLTGNFKSKESVSFNSGSLVRPSSARINTHHPDGMKADIDISSLNIDRLLFAPFHGDKSADWGCIIRTFLMLLVTGLLTSWLVATVVSLTTSGNIMLNALIVGLVQFVIVCTVYNWRSNVTYPLPLHSNLYIAGAEVIHGRLGLIPFVFLYGVALYAGSFLAWPIVDYFGYTALPTYVNPPTGLKHTDVGGFVMEFVGVAIIVFSYMYNHMDDYQMRERDQEDKLQYKLTGFGTLIAVLLFFGSGMWAFNPTIWTGPAGAAGIYSVVDGLDTRYPFAIHIFSGGLGVIIGYLAHWILWNINQPAKMKSSME